MAFAFRLYLEDGADIGTFTTAVPGPWLPEDEFLIRPGERYRIVSMVWENDEDADFAGYWVVCPVRAG